LAEAQPLLLGAEARLDLARRRGELAADLLGLSEDLLTGLVEEALVPVERVVLDLRQAVGGLQQGDVVRALALLANAGGVLVQGDAREATGDAGERLARACALQGDARPEALGGFVRRAARTRQGALLHLALTIALGNDGHGTPYVAVVP